jgi:hypothetical protein
LLRNKSKKIAFIILVLLKWVKSTNENKDF